MRTAPLPDRVYECRDIVRRIGVLSPTRVHIRNYPASNPVALFNPAALRKGEYVELYARIIAGYYMYVSAILRIDIPLLDILNGYINRAHYTGEIVIYPSSRYDIWGAEDPRVTLIDGLRVMVYSGRTSNYFDPLARYGRVLPILAVSDETGRKWRKMGVFILPDEVREKVIADKDAFLVRYEDGSFLLFHRPHLEGNDGYHLVVSRIKEDTSILFRNFSEIEVHDTAEALAPASFEIGLGWGTPPVEVEPGKHVVLVHAIDRETQAYRAFALLLRFRGSQVYIEGLTPFYIFEPREIYEIYGDRPMVVFPSGMVKVDDELIVVYGAGDYVIGFGSIEISELMALFRP